ncbi:hypothetical protein COCNU_scaffold005863G000030 [Cocos nucifera]|nr:hypothetical protein [Cocos nucifera]
MKKEIEIKKHVMPMSLATFSCITNITNYKPMRSPIVVHRLGPVRRTAPVTLQADEKKSCSRPSFGTCKKNCTSNK